MQPTVESPPSKQAKHAGPRASLADLRRYLGEGVQRAQELGQEYRKNSQVHECLLYLQRALACLNGDEEDLALDSTVDIDWGKFGTCVRDCRQRANLGQKELAAELDISTGTIRAIESGTRRPSRDLLLRMMALPSLGLRMEDIAADAMGEGIVPTSWLAPHYDPTKMIADMTSVLNGTGGALEQTTAYLDHVSAIDFLGFANSPAYLAACGNVAVLDQVAELIATDCGAGGLDVIALGCGDAKREIRLVEGLLSHRYTQGISDIRLFLLDVSHSLLTIGHRNARAILGGRLRHILALHGNFHDLPKYPLFSERDIKTRTRVFTMLGCTLANLDNEVRFFRDTLSPALKDDFFVTDFNNVFAPADQPDLIRKIDPVFQLGIRDVVESWLRGPLDRYVKGIVSAELGVELNTDSSIRGSYEITYTAQVKVAAAPTHRRFSLFRGKRYDPAQFEDFLRRSGWEAKARLPYGGNDRGQITLSLLKRM